MFNSQFDRKWKEKAQFVASDDFHARNIPSMANLELEYEHRLGKEGTQSALPNLCRWAPMHPWF